MADYKRSIRCSGCGNEITVYMNGNFDLTELSAVGRCPSCRSTIQVDFAMVEKEVSSSESSSASEETPPPLDMFSTPSDDSVAEEVSETTAEEETSDMMKDLME